MTYVAGRPRCLGGCSRWPRSAKLKPLERAACHDAAAVIAACDSALGVGVDFQIGFEEEINQILGTSSPLLTAWAILPKRDFCTAGWIPQGIQE